MFGRPNREADVLRGYAESLKDTNEKLFDLLAEEQAKSDSLVQTLDRTVTVLQSVERELAELKAATPVPTQMVGNAPLYMSEQEEDLQWQVDNGIISKDELQEILREANIENTEIEFN